MKRYPTSAMFFVAVLTVALWFTPHAFADDTGTTYPAVSEELCPVEFIQLTKHASAAVRKPPGHGPRHHLHEHVQQGTRRARRERQDHR
ncbi:MAG: hypothetical protein IIC50_15680 [Planctomycetes bacterium]|nr:hypothetical protein [Planctomycetota bacterium]